MEIGEIGDFEPNAQNCDIDNKAVEAGIAIEKKIDTDGLNNNSKNQTEYGAVIADLGGSIETGSVIQGQSYNQADPPATNLTLETVSALRTHKSSELYTRTRTRAILRPTKTTSAPALTIGRWPIN